MIIIRFQWPVKDESPVDVECVDEQITCTRDGQPAGVYTMGSTMIVGSTILSTDIRKAIHAEIERTLANARAL
jgi:hypothetical protein